MPAAICILFLLLLLCFPELCVRGAADGLALWLFTLVPTFFPFLFLSNLMVSCGAVTEISRFCGRVFCPLFRVSEAGAYILLMGFLCGYPMGAKLTAEFVKTGRISLEEGSLLLTFCNNPSPMFLVGFVLTDCMREPYSRAITLAMFYAGPILTGLLLSRGMPRKLFRKSYTKSMENPARSVKSSDFIENTVKRTGSADFIDTPANRTGSRGSIGTPAKKAGCISPISTPVKKADTPDFISTPAKKPTFSGSQIRASMSDAFATLLYLGGYVILFHIGSTLILSLAGRLPEKTYPFFCLLAASLEMSGGATYLSASGQPAGFVNLFVPLCVISGGICIMAQTAGLLSGSTLSAKPYIFGKLMQTAIAAGIFLLQFVF